MQFYPALLPIARFSVGRGAGPVALALCLTTGYLYGSLFFTPIDVPFLAAIMQHQAFVPKVEAIVESHGRTR